MKKFLAVMLVVLITLTGSIVCFADGDVQFYDATYMAAMEWTLSEFMETDFSRAVAATFMSLDYMTYVDSDVLDKYMLYGSSIATDGDWIMLFMPGVTSDILMIMTTLNGDKFSYAVLECDSPSSTIAYCVIGQLDEVQEYYYVDSDSLSQVISVMAGD